MGKQTVGTIATGPASNKASTLLAAMTPARNQAEQMAMDLAAAHGLSWGDMSTYDRQKYRDAVAKDPGLLLNLKRPVGG